jgi:predicted transcriptional regulator
MEHDIKDMKRLRKQLGLTQVELSSKSGVSQSMIAKIESGLIDPSYSRAKKIFDLLDSLRLKNQKKAKDIMIKKVNVISPDATIHTAINMMQKYSISQIPVVEKNSVIGLVDEASLLDATSRHKKSLIVRDVMLDNPPTVNEASSLEVVVTLLKFYPLVIVMENGKLKGVITKYDILSEFY